VISDLHNIFYGNRNTIERAKCLARRLSSVRVSRCRPGFIRQNDVIGIDSAIKGVNPGQAQIGQIGGSYIPRG